MASLARLVNRNKTAWDGIMYQFLSIAANHKIPYFLLGTVDKYEMMYTLIQGFSSKFLKYP
jgi:hypothetical protein